MKKNIKILAIVAVVLLIGGFVYYYMSKNDLKKDDSVLISEKSILGCYVANLSKDIYTLTILSQEGESFEGKLNINNFEKDSSTGSLKGTYRNGILLGDFTFQSEGIESVVQVIFIKAGDNFIRGYGAVDKETGTRFVDIKNIQYDPSVVYNFTTEGCEVSGE